MRIREPLTTSSHPHRRRGSLMRSAGAVLVAGTLLMSTYQLVTHVGHGDAAEVAAATLPAGESIKVMTWNIHYGVSPSGGAPNLDAIERVIADENPDVVALQEIHRQHDPGEGPDGDPGHPNQIEAMKDRLRQHGYVDFYGTPEGTMGKFIASKYDLTNKGYWELPKDEHGATGIVAHASVAREGKDLRVYATHLQSPDTDYHRRLRDDEVRALMGHWGSGWGIDNLQDPIVLMGDFNLRPDDAMKSLIADRGFIDTWTTVHNSEHGVTTNGGHDENCHATVEKVKRIDYVFGSPAIATDGGHVRCSTDASDHEPVIMRVRVKSDIELSGSVRAGDLGRAGWAHLTVYKDKSAKLIVCDNAGGDWRVTARGYVPYQGDNFVKGSDGGSDRGMCQKYRNTEPANFRHVALKTCLKNKNTGQVRDCRKHGMLERVYLGEDKKRGYVQYRVGVDNGVTAKACDTQPDGWTVRSIVRDGDGEHVASAWSSGDGTCESGRGTWPWTKTGLTTETCLVKDGETKGCKRKKMAYAA